MTPRTLAHHPSIVARLLHMLAHPAPARRVVPRARLHRQRLRRAARLYLQGLILAVACVEAWRALVQVYGLLAQLVDAWGIWRIVLVLLAVLAIAATGVLAAVPEPRP